MSNSKFRIVQVTYGDRRTYYFVQRRYWYFFWMNTGMLKDKYGWDTLQDAYKIKSALERREIEKKVLWKLVIKEPKQ